MSKDKETEKAEEKLEFLSLISHEVRTPLSITIGYTDIILEKQDLPPDVLDCVLKIKKNSEQLLFNFSAILEQVQVESLGLSDAAQPIQETFSFYETPSKASVRVLEKLEGVRILLIEDTLEQQMLIKRLLEREGAVVSVASNGFEGLEKAAAESFDIILSDIRMPGIDGYETASQLRKQGWKNPIIAITAHDLKEERGRALNNDFDDFQLKPVSRFALVNSIQKLLKISSGPQQLSCSPGEGVTSTDCLA